MDRTEVHETPQCESVQHGWRPSAQLAALTKQRHHRTIWIRGIFVPLQNLLAEQRQPSQSDLKGLRYQP